MAVLIQFTTLLIRIDRLTAVDPNGVAAVQDRWSPSWRDDHLLAVAFMDMGARDLAAELEKMGLTLRDTSSGTRVWRDICVVDYYEGPTNPCPWLEYDQEQHVAWLKGTDRGEVAGPPRPHEEAPVRLSPAQLQALVEQQYPKQPPAPAKPAAPASSPAGAKPRAAKKHTPHEEKLLPITQKLAAEIVFSVPRSAKIAAIVFVAHFPEPGKVVKAGIVIHELEGELRSFRIMHFGKEAKRLLEACAHYWSDNRVTSIEIKIGPDGECITKIGVAPPRSAEELEALLERRYGGIPRAHAPGKKREKGVVGWLRGLFAPKLKLYPLPVLRHRPQSGPLWISLDEFQGIDEGWDHELAPDSPSAGSSPSEPPPDSASLVGDRQRLEANSEPPAGGQRPVPADAARARKEHLEVPAEEGVLFAEARDICRLPVAVWQKRRPDLRFDPFNETLSRDLDPGLGELCFSTWDGNISRADVDADDIPSFDALLERLEPVLAALGGLGPIVCALGTQHPGAVREAVPIRIDDVRKYLIDDSPFGSVVYPCWLLGAPLHVKVSLDLSVSLKDGRQTFGYLASLKIP